MRRYRLDELGWAQFEWLTQSLLKLKLGLAVEAWGGHSDHGCDAWSAGPLYFPLPNTQEAGPSSFNRSSSRERMELELIPALRLLRPRRGRR